MALRRSTKLESILPSQLQYFFFNDGAASGFFKTYFIVVLAPGLSYSYKPKKLCDYYKILLTTLSTQKHNMAHIRDQISL